MERVNEFSDIIDKLKTIRLCQHEPEVEARYEDNKGFRFQMCRECWNHKEYHEISEDSVQVIRPNQLDVVFAKCLACGSCMDSCGCGAA